MYGTIFVLYINHAALRNLFLKIDCLKKQIYL